MKTPMTVIPTAVVQTVVEVSVVDVLRATTGPAYNATTLMNAKTIPSTTVTMTQLVQTILQATLAPVT